MTPNYPAGARASSGDSAGGTRYGTDAYKSGQNTRSILLAAGARSSGGSHEYVGSNTIAQDDMIVKADIGFSNKNGPGGGPQQSFWAAMTDNTNLHSAPLLSLGSLSDPAEANRRQREAESKRERSRSLSRDRTQQEQAQATKQQNSTPSSREATPPRSPGKATSASLSAPDTPPMQGYTSLNASGAGLSARGTPHGHISTALPSPHGSAQSSARGRRQVSRSLCLFTLSLSHCLCLSLSLPLSLSHGPSLSLSVPLSLSVSLSLSLCLSLSPSLSLFLSFSLSRSLALSLSRSLSFTHTRTQTHIHTHS